jgi:hypothetical protein
MSPQLEMFKGTLDLMVLRTLQAMGAMHGFGIAREDRTGQRGRYLVESRDDLRVPGTAAAARVDSRAVGYFRKQPESEILFHHQTRFEALGGGGGELGAHGGGDGEVLCRRAAVGGCSCNLD